MYSDSDSLIQAQMQADAQKQQAQRRQIMSETANAIHDINSQTYINMIQTSNRSQSSVLDLIRF